MSELKHPLAWLFVPKLIGFALEVLLVLWLVYPETGFWTSVVLILIALDRRVFYTSQAIDKMKQTRLMDSALKTALGRLAFNPADHAASTERA